MIQRDRLLDDNESTALDSTETDAQTDTSKTPQASEPFTKFYIGF